MGKPLTFRGACAHLDISENNSYNGSDENKDLTEDEDSLWKPSDDEKQGAANADCCIRSTLFPISDDEGDVEKFVKRGSAMEKSGCVRVIEGEEV